MGIPVEAKNCPYGILMKSYLWGNRCVWTGQDLFVFMGKFVRRQGEKCF